jgi:hypothetical protein
LSGAGVLRYYLAQIEPARKASETVVLRVLFGSSHYGFGRRVFRGRVLMGSHTTRPGGRESLLTIKTIV